MTSFRMFAGTHTGLRENNEDNFIVCPNLTLDEWMVPANTQETIQLGEKGCMMVVADGMGGMNAGEVASDIAIKTVHEMFSPGKMPELPEDRSESEKFRREYLRKVIVEADRRIKHQARMESDQEGMGSTIVMAWITEGYVYVAWLGDSRAYSYLPGKGITRLSKDHSYVQELVDAGRLSEEEAMHHQLSNIITRSLGDTSKKAKPDVNRSPLEKGEIILLCSDGLCGTCTDAEIAEIIEEYQSDLRECKEALTEAALDAGGSDNITIALTQIAEAPEPATDSSRVPYSKNKEYAWLSWQTLLPASFALFLTGGLCFAGLKCCNVRSNEKGGPMDAPKEEKAIPSDTVPRPKPQPSQNINCIEQTSNPKAGQVLPSSVIGDSLTNKPDLDKILIPADDEVQLDSNKPTPSRPPGFSAITPQKVNQDKQTSE